MKYDTFLGIEKKYSDLKTANFVVLLVPFEKTTTFQKGTKYGPKKLVEASYQVELFDEELVYEPYKAGIATKNFVHNNKNVKNYLDNLAQYVYREIVSRDKIPFGIGGEHSISLGLIGGIKKKYNDFSVLHIDAHGDLRDEYEGSPYNHACAARRWLDFDVNTVQLGIRNISKQEYDFYQRNRDKLHIFFAKDYPNGPEVERVLPYLKKDVYITIDLDGFDVSVIRGTGTPEPGGLLWHPTLKLLETVIKNRNILGFDIVELMPIKGEKISEFIAAKLCYKLISYYTYYNKLHFID